MDKISSWNESVMRSLETITQEISKIVPNLLGAIAILIIGWILTKITIGVVKKILKIARADKLDEKINKIELVEGKSMNIKTVNLVTKFIKYILYIMLAIVVTDVLHLTMISQEIRNLLGYMPKLFGALIIFVFGLLFANFIKTSLSKLLDSMELSGSKFLSQTVFFILLVFISITALNQAGVDTEIITGNITLIIGAFLLSFAIAFGIGAHKIVTDLLRTFYARKIYEVGKQIKVKDVEGEILALENNAVIIKTKEGKKVIPIKEISENQVSIKESN